MYKIAFLWQFWNFFFDQRARLEKKLYKGEININLLNFREIFKIKYIFGDFEILKNKKKFTYLKNFLA